MSQPDEPTIVELSLPATLHFTVENGKVKTIGLLPSYGHPSVFATHDNSDEVVDAAVAAVNGSWEMNWAELPDWLIIEG